MALVSPGVQVTVIDESNYAPNAIGSVAYILLATAQNKPAPGGVGIAAGTLPENGEKIYTITSQRDLVTTFGTPIFKTTASGAPINADEQNEYGLMAAYSLLGVSNQIYVQRANVDLGGLTGTAIRPLANPSNGTYWLDTANTEFGIYEWDAGTQEFGLQSVIVITDADFLDGSEPNVTVGAIGNYAAVAVGSDADLNKVYYKIYDNTWQLIGTQEWQMGLPTITGTVTNAIISANSTITINTIDVDLSIGANLATVASEITANLSSAGVTARVSNNLLVISGDETATSDGSTEDGIIDISNGSGTPLTDLGISVGTYAVPAVSIAPYFTVPNWEGNVALGTARPTGSIWQKSSVTGTGLQMAVKRFNTTTGLWVTQIVNDYENVFAATFGLDPTGGGINVPSNALFCQYNASGDNTPAQFLWRRAYTGATVVTGDGVPTSATTGSFTVTVRPVAGSANTTTYTVTVSSGTLSGFISAVSAAAIPNVTAAINSAGNMTLIHSSGGDMILDDGAGSPLNSVGINTSAIRVYENPADTNSIIGTNWEPLSVDGYSTSATQPYVAPADNTLWYYNTPARVDIMVSNGSAWCGYQTITDIRGYDLTQTNPTGPIISSNAPTEQDDGTALEYGDLWVDTSDLANYPKLYRWQNVAGVNQWVLIDNTDNTGQNGITFADARWAPNGSTDPVTDPIPSIADLAQSDYVDLDAPDPAFYPRGMLLWNTRASGFNIKQYKSNYFSESAYPDESLPSVKNTWLSVAGYQEGIVPNFGRNAQRGVVIAALKSAVNSSIALREDQNVFNLIACPGYPEVIPNLVALNEDRNNTAFIIGDTPLTLPATGAAIIDYATYSESEIEDFIGANSYNINSPYVGIYYPSGLTSDLNGQAIVVPPSHAVLRAMIKSDNFSYPWLAPAGTRRGLIDNLTAIGYVSETTGEFISIGVTEGLRDVMYQNKINPLTNLPGSGLVIYGQKTASVTPSAMDRINVARLINYLRGQLNTLVRPFVFEPNDPITRSQVAAVCSSLFNDLIAKRGITDYLVVCDTTNNTPDRIARNELWVDVAIQPTKAVEFIYIPIRLKNPGEIQAGNLASAQTVGTGA